MTKTSNRNRAGVIILIAIILMTVIFMYTLIVFRQTRQQTWDSGIYQLEIISSELEDMISEAENYTLELAISAEGLMDDREALEDFIYEQRDVAKGNGTGAFNVYVASIDWMIIPGFTPPDDYVLENRIWYSGAVRNQGQVYVTPPYKDAITGDICYSVTVLIDDEDTVLGVDYAMDNISDHVKHLYEAGKNNAVIITSEGTIAGCMDEELIGQYLIAEIPDYAGVWSLAKNTKGVATAKIRSGLTSEYLFATKTRSGWYLIVSVSDWVLFHDSYIQLLLTILSTIALFAVVILLFILSVKSQRRAEEALKSKEEFLKGLSGELRVPLNTILQCSERSNAGLVEDYDMELARIHKAGEDLSEMIGQILSYSSIVKTDVGGRDTSEMTGGGKNRRYRAIITLVMILVMLISLYANISAATSWGREMMNSKSDSYEFQLSEWVNTQKSILDMFVSIISANPGMLSDYEGTIDYLNRITLQYPQISVSYMSNPDLTPSVYMNNGWKPDPGWKVEERPWYKKTLASEDGWSVSEPYYDDQTGGYCITISEAVYDNDTGEFLGIFGIDFFMDKLVEILGDSYTEDGYAFLVDTEGDIINHPYGTYQMTQDTLTNISSLPYGEITPDGTISGIFRDYDGAYRIMTATVDEASKFTLYVVSNAITIYGRVLVYALICIVTFLVCIIMIHRLLSGLIRWQDATNAQMKEAADAALAAGKAKSQFLAQMSHEIRTPINAVLGMNEMILRESDDETILDYSENIKSAGKTLLSLINSILDFTKIEDGKMEIIPVRYDTASLISNLYNSIRERARDKGLDFILEIDEILPTALYGDDVRLSQVIMNLLTNAVKYTEKGSVTLSIRKAGSFGQEVRLYVCVRDTGIGIRDEDRGKLLESFERLDTERNRHIEGTGLGMSIVTKLLSMMGSDLKIESTYGAGSSFSFKIKQGIADDTPLGDYSERIKDERAKAHEVSFFAPEAKVLVVDDNNMNLMVAKNLLKLSRIVPDLAHSGAEAIEMAADNNYDLILLDHMMPVMDGIEALKKMLEGGLKEKGTFVIALTANAVIGSREMYLKAGFDDYLTKPIEVEQLEKMLSKYLMGKIRDKVEEGERTGNTDDILLHPDEAGLSPADSQDATDEDFVEAFDEGSDITPLTDEMLEKLKDSGVDTAVGLDYCADDREIYAEVFAEYAKDHDEKKALLEEYYRSENWPEYRIIIHSLKSSSKTIGAMGLSDLAKNLEDAAAAEDTAYISKHHQEFLDSYDDLTGVFD